MRGEKKSATLTVVCALLCLAWTCQAYDTGHHFDLTENALLERGFGAEAIEVVQLQNWVTDWISQSPMLPGVPFFKQLKHNCELLHFDGLYNTQEVKNFWYQLVKNTKETVAAIVKGDSSIGTTNSAAGIANEKRFRLLSVLGMTLHAVQDFYTHSTFVEQEQDESKGSDKACYYSSNVFANENTGIPFGLHTGYSGATGKRMKKEPEFDKELRAKYPGIELEPHGDYTTGVNKDSYTKPMWDRGYVKALVVTLDWVDSFKNWIVQAGGDDVMWRALQEYVLATSADQKRLRQGLRAAFQVSAFVRAPGQDGHWKGKGSGNAALFGKSSARFITSRFQRKSNFMTVWSQTKIVSRLTHGLKSPPAAPAGSSLKSLGFVQNDLSGATAIVVRTKHAAELKTVGHGGDLFAILAVNGERFRESTQWRKTITAREREISPSWRSIKIVFDKNPVKISYHLFERDTGPSPPEELAINPAAKSAKPSNFFKSAGNWIAKKATSVANTIKYIFGKKFALSDRYGVTFEFQPHSKVISHLKGVKSGVHADSQDTVRVQGPGGWVDLYVDARPLCAPSNLPGADSNQEEASEQAPSV
eukprot:TRINITY_DN4605_c0_g1_i1.p1 TRINITY_DN4605_c0_g1~~TRINITY_DN4605_c0_g1_i1.p1  ORF type:complete len:589 (-),score=162.83 TRINITY_DN4605_c0_g1_i1:332-2098(-)